MADGIKYSVLLDFYKDVLPQSQARSLEMYYNQDYSLAEIGEQMGISRQGARDSIKRGESALVEFEQKLKLCEKYERSNKKISQLQKIIVDIVNQRSDVDKLCAKAELILSDLENDV